ncbi:LVIVD repeat-containing protein [Catalinimonas alkaloidigena]|uniref:Type IV secretion system putative lipoprotein virB7 n=1 Tax=Catalinimonas alkaloidigena TaxID=1075417 RepID=A0A1G9RB14_9BACT|nr:hypothetical protein [Catalinimonas alkaloidigena]SDM20414.1 LVIVD repeat-containing protein [Catalinimonas alkaloidigena]
MQKFTLFLLALLVLAGCDNFSSGDADFGTTDGVGGSTARFAISGNYLYTVDDQTLRLFNIQDPNNPLFEKVVPIGTNIETIFPKGNQLFIGSSVGMHIYDISQPADPRWLSTYEHVFSCDPVVADERYAYVTLSSDRTMCGWGLNQLDIIDIENPAMPTLVQSYDMTAPKGLGVTDSLLFVCDDGLKVFGKKDVTRLHQLQHFRIEAHDLIPLDGTLMVIGSDALYQYRYEGDSLQLLSKLDIAI